MFQLGRDRRVDRSVEGVVGHLLRVAPAPGRRLLGGRNIIGRFAERPVDIDLIHQEAEGQIWSSRQHAVVTYDREVLVLEDLNSLNGTWVNATRVPPGTQRMLKPNDVIQIGTVQLKVVV